MLTNAIVLVLVFCGDYFGQLPANAEFRKQRLSLHRQKSSSLWTVPNEQSQTSMSSSHKVVLRPARQSDIPTFVHISGTSFEHDTHTQLKGLAQDPAISAPEYMAQGFDGFFESRFGMRTASVIAATIIDPDGEETVVGYLVTGSRGLVDPQQGQSKPSFDAVLRNRGEKPASPDPASATGTVKNLANLTDRSMTEWMNWFLTPPLDSKETRCYFIVSMSVDPAYHSKGVGSALMQELMRKCDAANVPCWVQSSDGAYEFYQKHGFVEAGRLELELDRFNTTEDGRKVERTREQGHSGEQKWGRYCWAYMERPPGKADN